MNRDNEDVMAEHKVIIILDDDGTVLVRLSDRPETLSRSCYGIYFTEFSID